MNDLQAILESRLQAAVAKAFGSEHADADPAIRPSNNPKFGDYQANLAMALGKKLGRKPRDVADEIVAALDSVGLFSQVEVAGPGFINLTLDAETLNTQASAMSADAHLGVAQADPAQTVVIDYSAPNVAKEMHVGHLRSTVIGDALARTFDAVGQKIIRQNHLGDWGTQFGMLITNLLDQGFDPAAGNSPGELTKVYKDAKLRFDNEPDFVERARQRVVKLQAGDEETLAVWKALVEDSKKYFDTVYQRLGVLIQPEDAKGESFYNDRLPGVIDRLEKEGRLKKSQGADVVYAGDFKDRDGEPLPMIVRKADGGYLYATTDLAAAMHRAHDLKANRIVYVIGSPQKQHVDMFTTMLYEFGWIDRPDSSGGGGVRMDFVGFGSVLGKDKKMFKTRSGETIRLVDLIDEAESRAESAIAEKNPDLPPEERKRVAEAVGVGALKYADLSSDRVKDYVFDWDRMLALDGNTAPYLLYSYARIRSIFRKGEVDFASFAAEAFAVGEPAERALVLQLLQFAGVVENVAETLEPHRLCNYLYELATRYHRFFEQCPVLRAEDEATKSARLALCHLTARALERGLGLLGINVVERM
ncbi:MAG: arginine--tRNA ligase [Planctomycetota bacterium]